MVRKASLSDISKFPSAPPPPLITKTHSGPIRPPLPPQPKKINDSTNVTDSPSTTSIRNQIEQYKGKSIKRMSRVMNSRRRSSKKESSDSFQNENKLDFFDSIQFQVFNGKLDLLNKAFSIDHQILNRLYSIGDNISLLSSSEINDPYYIPPPRVPKVIRQALFNYISKRGESSSLDQRWVLHNSFDQSSLLHYACAGDQYEVVKFLLENGVDINIQNSSGKEAEYFTFDDKIKTLIWSYSDSNKMHKMIENQNTINRNSVTTIQAHSYNKSILSKLMKSGDNFETNSVSSRNTSLLSSDASNSSRRRLSTKRLSRVISSRKLIKESQESLENENIFKTSELDTNLESCKGSLVDQSVIPVEQKGVKEGAIVTPKKKEIKVLNVDNLMNQDKIKPLVYRRLSTNGKNFTSKSFILRNDQEEEVLDATNDSFSSDEIKECEDLPESHLSKVDEPKSPGTSDANKQISSSMLPDLNEITQSSDYLEAWEKKILQGDDLSLLSIVGNALLQDGVSAPHAKEAAKSLKRIQTLKLEERRNGSDNTKQFRLLYNSLRPIENVAIQLIKQRTKNPNQSTLGLLFSEDIDFSDLEDEFSVGFNEDKYRNEDLIANYSQSCGSFEKDDSKLTPKARRRIHSLKPREVLWRSAGMKMISNFPDDSKDKFEHDRVEAYNKGLRLLRKEFKSYAYNENWEAIQFYEKLDILKSSLMKNCVSRKSVAMNPDQSSYDDSD